ncbi:response regulator [Pseudoxanthomonas sp. 10H]|uniref:response regulator n=1 Tax=Pseudoxanthomonas sp. 10H TaxID=3242729 RepID=UPI003557F028
MKPAPPDTCASGDPAALPAARILVAEDHPVNRAVVGHQLRRLGCVPILVEDGRQALDALARDRYDLLLTDCRMPGLDGFALARAVRRGARGADPWLPIVAMSGTGSHGSRQACLAAGMDGYLAKPAPLDELQRELVRHLGRGTPARSRPAGPVRERRLARRLVDAFGSTGQARGVLQPLLDACRADLAALDLAARRGEHLRERELLHRLAGALALVVPAGAGAARGPPHGRDELARRTRLLQRLLSRLPPGDPPRGPA